MNQTIPTIEERQIEGSTELGSIISLENLIKSHVDSIDKTNAELKQHST